MKNKLIFTMSVLLLLTLVSTAFASPQWVQYTKIGGNLLDDACINIRAAGGSIYIGTESGGITVLKGEEKTNFTSAPNGLSSNHIKAIDVDGAGQIAAGTASGLSFMDSDGTWHRFTKANSGILGDEVTAVAFDNAGGIWAGIKHLGLSHRDKDGSWKSYNAFNTDMPSNDIRHIAVGNDGGLWVATYPVVAIGNTMVNQKGGAGYLDKDGNWTYYNEQNSSLPSSRVNSVTLDGKGGKWFATQAGAAYLSAAGNWQIFTENKSDLPEDTVKRIAVDSNDSPWFATWGGGLAYMDTGGNWHNFTRYNSQLGNNYLHTVETDAQNNIWIGTNIGVFKYSPDVIPGQLALDRNKIEVVYNNRILNFDTEPFIDNGTTFVPMRKLADEFGLLTAWDGSNQKVFLTNQNLNIELNIGKLDVYRNGHHSALLAPPRLVNDRTMVPVRFIIECLGIDVTWDDNTRTVYINR